MLAFESAVHETCRADLGRWKVVQKHNPDTGSLLMVKRVGPAPGPDRHIADVLPTTDLRLAENDDGYEDETARANANLIADAPALLMALAQLLDASLLCGTQHPRREGNYAIAVDRARQLLAEHADVQHAGRWWMHAQSVSPEEVDARINQLDNGEC